MISVGGNASFTNLSKYGYIFQPEDAQRLRGRLLDAIIRHKLMRFVYLALQKIHKTPFRQQLLLCIHAFRMYGPGLADIIHGQNMCKGLT